MGWRDAYPCLWPRPLVSTFSVKAENKSAVPAGHRDGLHRAVKVCECDRGTKKETIDPKRRHRRTAHVVVTGQRPRGWTTDPNHTHRHGLQGHCQHTRGITALALCARLPEVWGGPLCPSWNLQEHPDLPRLSGQPGLPQ